mmetsp:Transcript_33842/g.91588  ORF Transcript_33842/g.91588 Transcript_33842/m.91588 type:complete len:384 (-) Transcript_33842:16-1167(-)
MGAQCCAAEPGEGVGAVEELHTVDSGNAKEAAVKIVEKEPGALEEPGALGPIPNFTVHIVSARGLRDADWLPGYNKSDCEVRLLIDGVELYKTKVIPDCLEPVWNEQVAITSWQEGQPLEFCIQDDDLTSTENLGKVTLPPSAFDKVGFNGTCLVDDAGKGIKAYLRLKIKLPGKDLPPGPASKLEVKCPKGKFKSWGLDLDTQDNELLFVTEVNAGPFATRNETVHPEEQVIKNDFIASVNGIQGTPAALLNEFRLAKEVTLEVWRSQEHSIVFERDDEKIPLGLQFPRKPAGDALVITEVDEEGAAAMMKERAAQKQQKDLLLMPGDRIVAISGFRGKADDLQDRFAKLHGKVQVSVVRPIREEPEPEAVERCDAEAVESV